ncbi:MAG: metallophosphoesterase [Candidatus Micrarchaeota archaeon]
MQFLYNEPAALHRNALLIGDTHFGMEYKLRQKGIHERTFSERVVQHIEQLLKKTKAKKLIIAGDVKDQIGGVDDITVAMLQRLQDAVEELIIVKGNHDGGIEATGATVVPADGFSYYGVGIFHGHSWPGEEVLQCKQLLSAHQHPQVEFRDRSGKRHFQPVWVVAQADAEEIAKHYESFNKKSQLILMPAFNPLVGSSLRQNEHLGPVLNNNLFKLNAALLFSLDGTLLGKLGDIKTE